jgi:iron complex outermembrane receptor protein
MKNSILYGRFMHGVFTFSFLFLSVFSLKANNETRMLTEVLQEFTQRHHVFFTYDAQALKKIKVNFEFRANESLEKGINRLLSPTGYSYRAFGNKYYVIHKKTRKGKRNARKLGRHIRKIQKLEQKGLELQFQKKRRDILLTDIQKQILDIKITGQVTSLEEEEPLPGATVKIKGTSIGTVTDYDGNYSLEAPEDAVLVISFLGYITQEVEVNGQAQINITLSTDVEQLQEVTVTGIRGSYAKARQAKRNANRVIDGISSEDIGKLPDPNIAEALQRVTGVQIQREDAGGAFVSIRGLDPTFTKVTINGQSQTAARSRAGDTGYNLSILGSSIASSLEVIKSPTADMEEGGVGGTVNIVKRRPFDIGETKFNIGIKPTYEVEAGKLNPRFDAFYNTLLSDKIGISFSAFYLNRDFKRIRVRGESSPEALDLEGDGTKDAFIQDRLRPRLNKDNNEQFSLSSTLEFKASDKFSTYLEATYGKIKGYDTRFDNDIRIRTSNVVATGAVVNETGFLEKVPVNGFRSLGAGGFTNDTEDELLSLAAGFKWQMGAKTKLAFEAARSLNKKVNDDHPGFGLGFGLNGAAGDFDPTPDNGDDVIANLLFTAAGSSGFQLENVAGIPDFSNLNNYTPGSSIGSSGTLEKTSAKEYSFKADLEHLLNAGIAQSLKFGFKFTSRKEDERNFRREPLDRSKWIPSNIQDYIVPITEYADNGIIENHVYYAVNVRPFVSEIFSDPANFRLKTGNANDEMFADRTIFAGYGMLNFGNENAKLPFRGNIGLRLVHTDTETQGFAAFGGRRRLEINSDGTIDGFDRQIANKSYLKALPSFNVALDLNDNWIMRLAGATVMRRPEIREMTPFFLIGIEVDEVTQNPILDPDNTDGRAGNPQLDPFEANQLDLTAEYYLPKGGLFSAGLFYKDVKNFITTAFELREVEAINTTGELVDVTVNVETFANGGGATVKGLEVNYQQPFSFLSGFLSGFGTALNYTLTDSETDESKETLDGTSKHSFNATLYYEKDNWGLRFAHNYRDSYRTGSGGGGQVRRAQGFSDVSAYYGFLDGKLKLTVNAVNIGN